jgi:hypothetical protein
MWKKTDGDEDHVTPFWIKVDYMEDLKTIESQHTAFLINCCRSFKLHRHCLEGYYNLDFP